MLWEHSILVALSHAVRRMYMKVSNKKVNVKMDETRQSRLMRLA